MASGIDWFRWHHGSVTDPKFQLVARKAAASLPDVLAVWAYLLEQASAAEFRGCFGDVDCEAIDCLFGFDDGKTDAIMVQMAERKLIADEYVVAWEKRQPKKEDVTAADRKRRQREREHELDVAGNVTHTESRDVTNVSDAVTPMSRHVTPCHDREEERREDISSSLRSEDKRAPRFDAQAHLVSIGIDAGIAADWLTHRKASKAAPTLTAINGIASEAARAGISLADALAMCCQRGWRGFKAEWLNGDQEHGARTQPPRRPTIHDERAHASAVLTGKVPARTTIEEFMSGNIPGQACGMKLIEGEVIHAA